MADPVESIGVIEVPFTLRSVVHGDEGAGETDEVGAEDVELLVLVLVVLPLVLPLFGADVHAVGGSVTVAAAVPFVLELWTVRKS